MNNVYMLRNHNDYGIRYEAGKVYTTEPAKAAEMVAKGVAAEADFPTLNNIIQSIDRAVEMYTLHADRIDKNTVMSAHERQYSILKAREALDEKVAQLKKEYETEIKALTMLAAQKAFKVESPTQEAQAFVDGVLIQLRTSNPEDVFSLIKEQLPLLDAPTKTELLRRFDELEKFSPGGFEIKKSEDGNQFKVFKPGIFSELLPKLKDGSSSLEHKILKKIGEDLNPDVSYSNLKTHHRTYKPGYLAQEVSAQYRSDREYEAGMAAIKAGE